MEHNAIVAAEGLGCGYQRQLAELGVFLLVEPDWRIRRLIACLENPELTSVGELSEVMRLSSASLRRLCARAYGLTAKGLIRRYRFARMLFALEHRPYREWRQFIDRAYCDQSHFIRDCHCFLGMAPSRYLAGRNDNGRCGLGQVA
jgi:methylphosphotriester-DNA--protein-cysteine methyltransferase